MQITRMALLRWRLIQLIDLVDDRIIGHRIYRICEWCGSSDWWEASYYQNGAKCPVDWDWYRDN